MLASVRRSALVALVSLLVVPSVASAQREPGGGYDDYESLGCSSERIAGQERALRFTSPRARGLLDTVGSARRSACAAAGRQRRTRAHVRVGPR